VIDDWWLLHTKVVWNDIVEIVGELKDELMFLLFFFFVVADEESLDFSQNLMCSLDFVIC
tara:strand:+ start:435 stop:614 length:180 start_codon:yes stop_codon:yes gene_type:complete